MLVVSILKLKFVGEKLWNSGSKQIEVLKKIEKKGEAKFEIEKKMINQIQTMWNSGVK